MYCHRVSAVNPSGSTFEARQGEFVANEKLMTAPIHRSAVCPVCWSADTALLIETPPVPVYCNVLWPTRAEALAAPTGDMRFF